jgi:hypothetical protein
VIGPRVRAQHRPVVAQPTAHVERPHAIGAHVAEGHWRPGLRSWLCAHAGEVRINGPDNVFVGPPSDSGPGGIGRDRVQRIDVIAVVVAFIAMAGALTGSLLRLGPEGQGFIVQLAVVFVGIKVVAILNERFK